MATSYRAAFGDPSAQKAVVKSLLAPQPDTSSDAALAAALAEDDRAAAGSRNRPASPSGVKVHIAPWESPPQPARPTHRRNASDGVQQQHAQQAQRRSTAGTVSGNTGSQFATDAALARQLQKVELEAVADATGTTPSLLFPDFLSQPSSRELTLNRTLSRAPSVRGNPRVAATALPEEPVCSEARQRLLNTLKSYDLVERQVAGDGNCQFRSLSDQLYGTPDHHASVRSDVVARLRQKAASYSCYVPGEYGDYVSSMARSGTWGDHLTLQAAADHYGVKIVVVTSYAESPVITIEPEQKRSPRTLYLSFWAEVHYNSLYPAQEPPPAPPLGPPGGATADVATSNGAGGGKPPKVLGSRTLGKVVAEMEKVTDQSTRAINKAVQEIAAPLHRNSTRG